ncbi:MAG: GHKL domain-containing protein [Peptococcaceae bacterium]
MKILPWLKTPVIFFGGQALVTLFITLYFSFFTQLLALKWAIIIFVLIFSNLFFALETLKIIKLNQQQKNRFETQEEKLKTLKDFNDYIRAQRHDYLNHIQTIYGLLQIGHTEAASEYLTEIVSEERFASQIMFLKKPEVNALLQRKTVQARNKGIAFELNIQTDLTYLRASVYDLNRILGNLIDNAFEAVVLLPPDRRQVKLEIYDDESYYGIKVINTGPEISPEMKQAMFDPGFTTKGEGRGMGLFIVKNIVDLNGGKIMVYSPPITFNVKLPKRGG